MQRAIGMVEFNSIARGIYAADQMVKISEVEIVTAASTCPGNISPLSMEMWRLWKIPFRSENVWQKSSSLTLS